MKPLLLALVLVTASTACCSLQSADANEAPTETARADVSVSDVAVNVQATPTPQPVESSKFESVRVKRIDQHRKFSIAIDLEYPRFKNPRTQNEIKFNRLVKSEVDREIHEFSRFLTDKEKDVKDRFKPEYELNLNYRLDFVSDRFVSLVMDWNAFSGYLNYDYFPSTINFDLRRGQDLKLGDIFLRGSTYLNMLSDESRKILKKTCLACGCGNGISAGDPLPEELLLRAELENEKAGTNSNRQTHFQFSEAESGTEPKQENFANWTITRTGLKITFGEYQVGPGCVGIINIVIPFDKLEPVFRNDLRFQ